tara:strand:- start:26977 stop:28260 length:1284 start_codon:yes stop_codon:yes gene_type:complete
MANVNGEAGFTQLEKLNITDRILVKGVLLSAASGQVLVKTASDLAGSLSSAVEYVIDGVIDMGSQSIEVPVGGLTIDGYSFDVSKLISSASNYTMFTSPISGSGDLLCRDFAIEVTGTSSKVYEVVDATGNNAIELARINYNDCTSLGSWDGYRQGLEFGTGRFGGKPELELIGTWAGGFFADVSIARGLVDGAYSIYKAGAGFSMASRFRSNQNIDLPASASFFDFSPSNFTNPSAVQMDHCFVTRSGVFNPEDSNLTPNITSSALACAWNGNVGMKNTFVGGREDLTAEVLTTISVINTFVDLAGTYTASDLQHFDSPVSGQLRHLGNNPREFKVLADLTIDGTANNVIGVKVVKWDDSAGVFVDSTTQVRQINSLVGGRDVAFFTITTAVALDRDDFVKLQVSNQTGTGNVTAELGSFYLVEER